MAGNFAALASLAWRESRTTRHRLLLASSSITLGVAALVAIDSFSANVIRSVREQSRTLLGGDIALSSRRAFPAHVNRTVDSLQRSGYAVARETTFPAMAVLRRSGATRLVQVRAVSPRYPLYGRIETEPAGRWALLSSTATALADPALLIALDARVGDTVSIGYGRFILTGAVRDAPGLPDIAQMLGPRVFISERYVAETQLLVLGSTASYDAFIRTDGRRTGPLARALRTKFGRGDVRVQTIDRAEEGFTQAIAQLRQFVGIVGMVALLLGGLGVASGVHAFVARKIDTVAVLRCVGATSRQVMAMYVAQAALMGIVGAAIGAAIGVLVQLSAPRILAGLLPINVTVTPEPAAIGLGLAVGAWVALVFSLGPLLALRRVSPLQTLRRDFDSQVLSGRRDVARHIVTVAIVLSVLAISFARAATLPMALGIAGGTMAALTVLIASGSLLSYAARRMTRAWWPYVLRQGVSNLHRPGNQTRSVVLALGFGAFIVTTLQFVQTSMLRRFNLAAGATGANVVFFDVQEDQTAGVRALADTSGADVLQTVPIVTMRIASVRGQRVADLQADTTPRPGRPLPWTLRWEYRSTYRDRLTSSEKLESGRWFSQARAGDTTEVSLEASIAGDLRVKVGDVVTWHVHGMELPSRVTSIRAVTWARFEPNFFAVFRPGSLDAAPKQFVVVGRTRDPAATARLQRDIVRRYPNVSSIDLAVIRRTVDTIVGRVTAAIRFLAALSLVMAVPVILSAVAATRRERLREAVLLKTLGATRTMIVRILASEYAALGLLGSLTGVLLGGAAAYGLIRYVFEMPFVLDAVAALVITAAVIVLTISLGILGAREVYKRTPMEALRDS